jgi:endo-1,4-beta-D-glucanase Y
VIYTDHFMGVFDNFETEIGKEGDEYYARALGLEARHKYQEQALNDLNAKLQEAILKGEIVPNGG